MAHLMFKSEQKQGFSVKYSPFFLNQLAYVANTNFGIQGCGSVFILEVVEGKMIRPLVLFGWKDVIFDMAWCEVHPKLCVTASGDGTMQLWNTSTPKTPIGLYNGHTKEVYSIQWSSMAQDSRFVTASWDGTAKVWCLENRLAVGEFMGHEDMVFCASWSPHITGCIASGSADKSLKVWNLRSPNVGFCTLPHPSDVLSCDWSKYDQNVLATGSGDGIGRIWDLRFPQLPVAELHGHKYAIKNIKFSPHRKNVVGTASYDFTTRLWDYLTINSVEVIHQHSEFVYGLDFNIYNDGEIADCSFDQTLHIYKPISIQPHF